MTIHQERLRFFELSLDMLCIARTDGYFEDLNPAWSRVLGYSLDELKSRPFVDFVHPDDIERTRQETAKLVDTGMSDYETVSFENRYKHRDGSYRVLLWTARADHSHQRIYALARDITVLRAMSTELERLNKELERRVGQRTAELKRSNRDLERFAYVASHDLQEPLRTVTSFLQLLVEDCVDNLPAKGAEYIDYAMKGAQRMRAQLDDLLTYSRLRTQTAPPRPLDSGTLLAEVLDDLRTQIEECQADVQCDALPRIVAVPSQLRQVFQNLLSNGLKFSGSAPPRIRIAAVPLEGEAMWHFTVADRGIGVPEQHREQIFDLFRRLHTRDDYPGTGLGLAICRRIVESHGGRIWADSAEGTGTTFHFTLPGVVSR